MWWISLISAAPFSLPLSCWSAGCACAWLCAEGGALACVAAAGLAATALLAGLSFLREFASLGALRD